jgi:hypothetical protein
MQRISSEFVGFVRETGVRAFDRLSTRSKDVKVPLRPVLRAWSKLSDDQKSDLFDELISTVQTSDASAPSPRKSSQQDIRRFDPVEVEATLPAKKSRKKAAAPKKKKK